MEVIDLALSVHSFIRWLILAVAVVGLVVSGVFLRSAAGYPPALRALASGYSGLLDLQVLIGLGLLIGLGVSQGTWPLYRFAHGFLGLLAAVIGHLPARWRDLSSRERLVRGLAVYALSLVVLLIAIPIALQG